MGYQRDRYCGPEPRAWPTIVELVPKCERLAAQAFTGQGLGFGPRPAVLAIATVAIASEPGLSPKRLEELSLVTTPNNADAQSLLS